MKLLEESDVTQLTMGHVGDLCSALGIYDNTSLLCSI